MEEALLPVSEEVIKKIRDDLNLDEEIIKESVNSIKRWIQRQPHLPNNGDDRRIERWLIRCKNRMETTKQKLEMYYRLRSIVPELMYGWDVNDKWFQDICESMFLIPMPTLTSEMDRITVMGLLSPNHPKFNFEDGLRILLQVFEILTCEDYSMKDIFVIDCKYFQLADVPKFNFSLIKKVEVCILKAFSPRVRAVHFINTPTYVDYIIEFIKGLMKKEIVGRHHVHRTDLTEFYKHVPQKLLPTEYGGNAGTKEENWNKWRRKIKSYGEWYKKQDAMKSDESRRPASALTGNELFGFEGSFRKLSID